jgi:hypothetical protein
MKLLILLILLPLILAGCEVHTYDNTAQYDQCLRTELFDACLEVAKSDTKNIQNLGTVVGECSSAAKYLSQRLGSTIKKECRVR